MKILIIGSGGREHAIVDKLNISENQLFCLPGNPGIWKIAQKVEVSINDFDGITSFCKNEKIDFVIIGPEQPLAMGLVNYLDANRIKVFGPTKEAAMLETSKAFAKEIMIKNNVPTANYVIFNKDNYKNAIDFINNIQNKNTNQSNELLFNFPIVLKADGLAAGKGVVICRTKEEAEDELSEMFNGKFGEASNKVVIEEYLEGEEVSIFAITDGGDYVLLSPAQDYKKIYDNNQGKNTGGMGSYAPVPFLDDKTKKEIEIKIIRPMIESMSKRGTPFKGCLYAGLMLTEDGPKVIEFNARFGDPETQAVLRLIDGDFSKLLYSAAIGKLDKNAVKILNEFACCVVLTSHGYPDEFEKGFEITGLSGIDDPDVKIYYAGTKLEDGKILTDGGRVLNISVKNTDPKIAIEKAYLFAELINFENKYYRKDIARKVLNYLS